MHTAIRNLMDNGLVTVFDPLQELGCPSASGVPPQPSIGRPRCLSRPLCPVQAGHPESHWVPEPTQVWAGGWQNIAGGDRGCRTRTTFRRFRLISDTVRADGRGQRAVQWGFGYGNSHPMVWAMANPRSEVVLS